jgi:hypothetical protein
MLDYRQRAEELVGIRIVSLHVSDGQSKGAWLTLTSTGLREIVARLPERRSPGAS